MLYPLDKSNDALVAFGRGAEGPAGEVSAAALAAAIDALKGGVDSGSDTLQELLNKINLRAPLASPAFTGNPTAPTQSAGNNSDKVSTTAFVHQELTNVAAELQPLDETLTAFAALTIAANKLVYGSGADAFDVTDLTVFARTILAAADADAVLSILGAEELANKGNANGYASLDSGGKVPTAQLPTSAGIFTDASFTLQDDGDNTKQARFQLSGIATATMRTYTLPNANVALAGTNLAQTFTGLQTFSRNAAALPAAGSDDVVHLGSADSVNGRALLDSFGGSFIVDLRRASGTAASPSATGSAQLIAAIAASGHDGTGYTAPKALIGFQTTEGWSGTANGTKVVVETTPNGSTTRVVRMEIGHDGALRFNAYGAGLLTTDSSGNVIPTTFPSNLLSINDGPLAGLRNRFLNGCMRINQRAITSAADGDYCFDRWYVLTETGNVGISRRTDFATSTPSAIRLTQPDASPKRMALCQVLTAENGLDLRGKTVTASFRGKLSATGNIRMAVLEWLGTEDAVTRDWVNTWSSGTYTGGNFFKATDTYVNAVSGSLAFTAATARAASLSATISNTANNIAVMIWTEGAQAQNVTLDLSELQLEIGGTASAFERRPAEMERSLCRAFFQSYGGDSAYEFFTNGTCNSTSHLFCPMNLVPAMWKPPALGYSALADLCIGYKAGGVTVPTAVSIGQDSRHKPYLVVTATGTPLTAGESASFGANNTTAARLTFSAEI